MKYFEIWSIISKIFISKLILIPTQAQFSPFPTEGNTFYVDLIQSGTNGQFYANMQVGSQKQ